MISFNHSQNSSTGKWRLDLITVLTIHLKNNVTFKVNFTNPLIYVESVSKELKIVFSIMKQIIKHRLKSQKPIVFSKWKINFIHLVSFQGTWFNTLSCFATKGQSKSLSNFHHSFKSWFIIFLIVLPLWCCTTPCETLKKIYVLILVLWLKKKKGTEALITFSSSFNKTGVSSRTQALWRPVFFLHEDTHYLINKVWIMFLIYNDILCH